MAWDLLGSSQTLQQKFWKRVLFPDLEQGQTVAEHNPGLDPSDEMCSAESEAQAAEPVKRDHTEGFGNKIPPERIVRAEELFMGVNGVAPLPPRAIERTLAREFGVTARTARRYMQLARQNIARSARNQGRDLDAIVARADARFDETYALARVKNDAASMVQATQRQAELHGVTKREVKVDATVKGLGDLFATVFDKAK
jgi:hypothetical protein